MFRLISCPVSKCCSTIPVSRSQHWPRFTHSLRDLSRRQIVEIEERLVQRVGTKVIDKILKRPIGSLNWLNRRIAVSDDNTVQILLKLPSLLHPDLEDLKSEVKDQAKTEIGNWLREKHLSFEYDVNVEAMAERPVPMMARLVEDSEELIKTLGPGLANVAHFVACYSCKGGVGKSSVAVNLAYELARKGGRVGLLDVDVYGPSLPILVKPKDITVRRSPKGTGMVDPIEHEGVKLLSLGFVNTHSGVPGSGSDSGASIMRGPLTVKVVAQLLKATDWGELDVLVLDLPPGTGDVQLAICQDIQLTGAVGVTTPSKLALEDTKKGIDMFSSLGVPTLSIVENMSYFKGHDGKMYHPFGKGVSNAFNVNVVRLPLSEAAHEANETGLPLTLSRPSHAEEHLGAYHALANEVCGHLLRSQYGDSVVRAIVTFNDEVGDYNIETLSFSIVKSNDEEVFSIRLFSDTGAVQRQIHPVELRSRDPKTGETIADSPFLKFKRTGATESVNDPSSPIEISRVKGKRSPSVIPVRVHRRGRYGFGVEWGDGATIIYSSECIAKSAGATISGSESDSTHND